MRNTNHFHPEVGDIPSVTYVPSASGSFVSLHLDNRHNHSVLTASRHYLIALAQASLDGVTALMDKGSYTLHEEQRDALERLSLTITSLLHVDAPDLDDVPEFIEEQPAAAQDFAEGAYR